MCMNTLPKHLYMHHLCVRCPGSSEIGVGFPWNWSYRWLWPPCVCWEFNSSSRAINKQVLFPCPIKLKVWRLNRKAGEGPPSPEENTEQGSRH